MKKNYLLKLFAVSFMMLLIFTSCAEDEDSLNDLDINTIKIESIKVNETAVSDNSSVSVSTETFVLQFQPQEYVDIKVSYVINNVVTEIYNSVNDPNYEPVNTFDYNGGIQYLTIPTFSGKYKVTFTNQINKSIKTLNFTVVSTSPNPTLVSSNDEFYSYRSSGYYYLDSNTSTKLSALSLSWYNKSSYNYSGLGYIYWFQSNYAKIVALTDADWNSITDKSTLILKIFQGVEISEITLAASINYSYSNKVYGIWNTMSGKFSMIKFTSCESSAITNPTYIYVNYSIKE